MHERQLKPSPLPCRAQRCAEAKQATTPADPLMQCETTKLKLLSWIKHSNVSGYQTAYRTTTSRTELTCTSGPYHELKLLFASPFVQHSLRRNIIAHSMDITTLPIKPITTSLLHLLHISSLKLMIRADVRLWPTIWSILRKCLGADLSCSCVGNSLIPVYVIFAVAVGFNRSGTGAGVGLRFVRFGGDSGDDEEESRRGCKLGEEVHL